MANKEADIGKLSQVTGFSQSEIKTALSGELGPRKPYFMVFTKKEAPGSSESILGAQNSISRDLPENQNRSRTIGKTISQEIAETDEPREIFSILERLSFDSPEFIPAYEKLILVAKREAAATDDLNELNELVDYVPNGSPEEGDLISKIATLELKTINDENDFDELVRKYQDETFYQEPKKYLVEKLIAISSRPSETAELIESVFPKGSLGYYLALTRHQELTVTAINGLTSIEEVEDLSESIDSDSDHAIVLARRIVILEKNDPGAIWSHESLFDDGSEALEVLAEAAISLSVEYSDETIETLDGILESFATNSRIGRMSTKKKHELLTTHLKTLTDPEDLKDHFDDLYEDDPAGKEFDERLIALIDDKDELHELFDDDTYLGTLAQEKLAQILLKQQQHAKSPEEIHAYSEYVYSGCSEEDQLQLRIVELISDVDEASEYDLADASYAMYRLAKKFMPQSPTPAEAVPQTEEHPTQELEDFSSSKTDEGESLRIKAQKEEDARKDEQVRRQISRLTSVSMAMKLVDTYPDFSEYKCLAYNKASSLLSTELANIRRKEECMTYLDLFPRRSQEWIDVLKKLSDFYPKPWYKFW